MKSIIINLPENLKTSDFEIKMIIASKLFEKGELSSGQAAAVVGISKREFIESVGKFGVSVFGYDFEELKNDIKNA